MSTTPIISALRRKILQQRSRIWVKGPRSVAYARLWFWQVPRAIQRGWWPSGLRGTLLRRIVAKWPRAVDEYPD